MRGVMIIAALAAQPAMSQEFVGRCIGGDRWVGNAGYASYQDCEGAGDDPLLIVLCEEETLSISVVAPFRTPSTLGDDLYATLLVGGSAYSLVGRASRDSHYDSPVMTGAALSPDALEALAGSDAGAVVTSAGTYPIHLFDSRDAITAMLNDCPGEPS